MTVYELIQKLKQYEPATDYIVTIEGDIIVISKVLIVDEIKVQS